MTSIYRGKAVYTRFSRGSSVFFRKPQIALSRLKRVVYRRFCTPTPMHLSQDKRDTSFPPQNRGERGISLPLFTDLSQRINEVSTKVDTKIEAMRTELKNDIKTTKDELKEDIKTTKDELKEDIKKVQTNLEKTKDELKDYMKINQDTTSTRFDNIEFLIKNSSDMHSSLDKKLEATRKLGVRGLLILVAALVTVIATLIKDTEGNPIIGKALGMLQPNPSPTKQSLVSEDLAAIVALKNSDLPTNRTP